MFLIYIENNGKEFLGAIYLFSLTEFRYLFEPFYVWYYLLFKLHGESEIYFAIDCLHGKIVFENIFSHVNVNCHEDDDF